MAGQPDFTKQVNVTLYPGLQIKGTFGIYANVDTSYIFFTGMNQTTLGAANGFVAYGSTHATKPGVVELVTRDAESIGVARVTITGEVDTATMTWQAMTIAAGDCSWTNVGDMTFAAGSILASGSTNGNTLLLRANDTTFITLTTGATDACTIANATMSGTWLASGTVVLPAVTMGDTIIITTGKMIKGSADDGSWSLVAGLNATYYDSNIWLYGSTHSTKPGSIELRTYSGGTPGTTSGVLRLTLAGNAATVAATWNAIYQVGMKFGLAGTATGAFTMDGATSGVVTVKVSDVAGTWTMTLPAAVAAAAGYQLADSDGAGLCTWTAAASLRELKNIIGEHSPQDALDKILHTRVYDFHYKEGKGTRDTDTLYTGIMADEAPWAMHFQGGIVNPVNTLGYMVLGFQAHEKRIVELELELAELKGRT